MPALLTRTSISPLLLFRQLNEALQSRPISDVAGEGDSSTAATLDCSSGGLESARITAYQ